MKTTVYNLLLLWVCLALSPTLTAQTGWQHLSFSHDDSRIYLLTQDGIALEWSLNNGKVKPLFGDVKGIFPGSGDRLTIVGTEQVHLWKSEALEKSFDLNVLPAGPHSRVATVSPFVILLAVADGDQVLIYNARTGDKLQLFSLDGRKVGSLLFSTDGKYLAAGLQTGQIIVWNTKTWMPAAVRTALEARTPKLTWHPNTNVLARTEGTNIRFIDIDNDVEWSLHKPLPASALEVAIHPISDQMAVAMDNGKIHLMHFRTGDVMKVIDNGDQTCRGLAYSPNGEWLGAIGQEGFYLFEARSGNERLTTTCKALLQQINPSVVAQSAQVAASRAILPVNH